MKNFWPIIVTAASITAGPLAAQDENTETTPPAEIAIGATLVEQWIGAPETVFGADVITLEDLRWVARPIIVFADSALDPAFQTQMELLTSEIEEVIERDIILITDTNPDAASALRTKLRPRGFQLVLIGKDGGVKLRKPFPWDMRELSRSIDKMPMRQRELGEGS